MERIITVRGMGHVSTKPDQVLITLSMETQDVDYSRAMALAADRLRQLQSSLGSVGFEKKAVKTTSFDVRTDYDRIKNKDGTYRSVFNGYIVNHQLKIEFDLDMERLSKALFTISNSLSNPEFRIRFTVKDENKVKDELLRSAAINAKQKAEILCEAVGAKLGNLQSINYNWSEIHLYSPTDMTAPMGCMSAEPSALELEPDDIESEDSVSFVWAIE